MQEAENEQGLDSNNNREAGRNIDDTAGASGQNLATDGDQKGDGNDSPDGLTVKMLTKAASTAAKTLSLTTSASAIEQEIREKIQEAKKGQLMASQRDVAGEASPVGEDVESWAKTVRKLNNKLDKHITANEDLGKSLRQHAENFKSISDSLLKLAEAHD